MCTTGDWYEACDSGDMCEACDSGEMCEACDSGDMCEACDSGDMCEACDSGDMCEACDSGDMCEACNDWCEVCAGSDWYTSGDASFDKLLFTMLLLPWLLYLLRNFSASGGMSLSYGESSRSASSKVLSEWGEEAPLLSWPSSS